MQGNRPGVKPFVGAMAGRVEACRGGRRANAGAEGINRRQFFAPEGDLDVPSGLAKNGGAHVTLFGAKIISIPAIYTATPQAALQPLRHNRGRRFIAFRTDLTESGQTRLDRPSLPRGIYVYSHE